MFPNHKEVPHVIKPEPGSHPAPLLEAAGAPRTLTRRTQTPKLPSRFMLKLSTRPSTPSMFFAVALVLLAASRLVPILSFPTAFLDFSTDDFLYARTASAMADGHWLGSYDEFTLVKSPGFPLFLAACEVTGIPFRWARELLWVAAVFAVVAALVRMGLGRWTALGTAGLLLWHPGTFPVEATRLVRESIHGQAILLFVGFWGLRLTGRRTALRWTLSSLMGLVATWLWLLREESPWLIPALLWVVISMVVSGRKKRETLLSLTVSVALLLAPIVLGVSAVQARNSRMYGAPVVNELDDPAFRSAIGAILRAEEHPKAMGLVRSATLSRLYEVSPALRELRDGIEGPAYRDDWAVDEHGDRYSNMLAWAVRNAAARKGHHRDAAAARAFYERLAREIHGACARGEISCRPRRDSLLPTFRPEDLGPFLRSVADTAGDVVLARLRPAGEGPNLPVRVGSDKAIHLMADVARENLVQDLAPWPERSALVQAIMRFVATVQPWLLVVAALGAILAWRKLDGLSWTPQVAFVGLAAVFLVTRVFLIAFTLTLWIPTAKSYLPCVFPLVAILIPFGLESFLGSSLAARGRVPAMAALVILGGAVGAFHGTSAADAAVPAWPLAQVHALTDENVMVQSMGLLPRMEGQSLVLEWDAESPHPWHAVRVRLLRPRVRGMPTVYRIRVDRIESASPVQLGFRFAGSDGKGAREGVLSGPAQGPALDVAFPIPEDLRVLDGFEFGVYGPVPVQLHAPHIARESANQDR